MEWKNEALEGSGAKAGAFSFLLVWGWIRLFF